MGTKDFIHKAANSISYPLELSERQSICKWLLIDKYEVSSNQIALNETVEFDTEGFKSDLTEIEKGVPLQQIVGFTYFADCKIKVNSDVLIPRPETEELVFLLSKKVPHAQSILDICTGSGCIAIGLKKAMIKAKVTGWDISKKALSIAKENALKNKVVVDFEFKDALSLSIPKKASYDLIISNPPYIKNIEKEEMDKTVLEHEPHIALFVPDTDPLLFYKPIVSYASHSLHKNGTLAFEINKSHSDEIVELLQSYGFKEIQVINDMSDMPRFVIACL